MREKLRNPWLHAFLFCTLTLIPSAHFYLGAADRFGVKFRSMLEVSSLLLLVLLPSLLIWLVTMGIVLALLIMGIKVGPWVWWSWWKPRNPAYRFSVLKCDIAKSRCRILSLSSMNVGSLSEGEERRALRGRIGVELEILSSDFAQLHISALSVPQDDPENIAPTFLLTLFRPWLKFLEEMQACAEHSDLERARLLYPSK